MGGEGRIIEMETEVRLSTGALEAMWREDGLRPVLQLADAPQMAAETGRYLVALSDGGARTRPGTLAASLNSLVARGALRRDTVVRVLEYFAGFSRMQRLIIVLKLCVLQSECNIMGNPKPYEMRNQPNEQVTNLPVNAENEPPLCITPVSALNPYQTRWKIKARVTAKTDLRHYNSRRGPKNVFSFDLLDGHGGEIRATCFNVQADQFFDLIEVDKVYLISEGKLHPAQTKFNSLNHEYEITLDHKTSIEVCFDDDYDSSISRQQYNFRPISDIENIEVGAIVDLVGIVTSVGPSAIVIRKDGTLAQNRTVQLKDTSVRSMEVILWGEFCNAEGHQLQLLCDSGSNPILSLKGGLVCDFSGRSVVTISSTQLKVNPNFPVAERLKQWYITEGKNTACVSI